MARTSEAHIAYAQRAGITPEAEVAAVASVLRFILECHAKKEAAPESRPDDEKERSRNDSLAKTRIP